MADTAEQRRSITRKIARLEIVWFFIRPYKIRLLFLLGVALTVGMLEMMQIALLYPLMSEGLEMDTGDTGIIITFLNDLGDIVPDDNILRSYAYLLLIVSALVLVSRLIYTKINIETAAKVVVESKIKVFEKYSASDYQFFIDNRQGDLLYRAYQAPDYIATSLNAMMKSLVEIVLLIWVFVLLVSLSWKGTIIVLICGLSYFLFMRYLSITVSYVTGRGMLRASESENVVLNEYITGIKQICATGTSSRWITQFNEAVTTKFKLWVKNIFWTQLPPYILILFMHFAIAIIIIVITILYPEKYFTMIPLFGTFAWAAYRLLPKMSIIGSSWMQVASSLPNLEMLREHLLDQTYSKIVNGEKEFSGLYLGIEFKSVGFTHKNRESTLKDVSLNIDKDKMSAIVGSSGSGKSTLVDLLLRLYDVDSGSICLDGKDLKEFDITSFQAKVGFVGQEAFIYNASIKDNITFGREYESQEVEKAAELANARDFIQQLPEGYDTVIGDRGIKLSGGEKQRIAIARAMIRKPQILILDEATSALDNVSERIVQDAIDKVSQDCTALVIAHRLSTIRNASIIYVLDEGKIVESGTHHELLEKKGKYWELFNVQEK